MDTTTPSRPATGTEERLRHTPVRLLGIWAHPDDEAYLSAGLMTRTVASGGSVTCVTATAGERGFADDDPRPLSERSALRSRELTRSLAAVGVSDSRLLGLPDGGCSAAPIRPLIATLASLIREVQPDTIVTFGPDGMTGHPDHITVGHAATVAWRRTGIGRLFHATATVEHNRHFDALHHELGIFDGPCPAGTPEAELGLAVDLTAAELDAKRAALRGHESQTAPLAAAMGESLYREWWSRETFREADIPFPVPFPAMSGDRQGWF